jgi:prepilin-type processing-associated H-X9-DG protein
MSAFRYKENKILLTDSRQGMMAPRERGSLGVMGVNDVDWYWFGIGATGAMYWNGVTEVGPIGVGSGVAFAGIDPNHFKQYANCLMLDGSVRMFHYKKHIPLNDYSTNGYFKSWWVSTLPSWPEG